ncbi:MAG: DUF262 domain-containing protein [Bacteroides sp.]|nr:DUF262 domain-containing protein [Bacteroides sp.]
MGSFQTPITIYQAIRRITAHELLLPSFQREYVWSPTQIENLFDSLMRGYPISSMLFWKVKGEAKAKYKFYEFLTHFIQNHRTIGASFRTDSINDFHAVLDGQQRLTSLYIGLCGTYAYHRYRSSWNYSEESFPDRELYLNISIELPEDENEKKYNFLFRDLKETQSQPLWIDSIGHKWFRIPEIMKFGDPHINYDLDDFAEEYILSKEQKKTIRHLEKVVFNQPLINYYEEDDSDPERAVNIFVRINSGGTPLSLSDILFSIVTANWRKDAKKLIPGLVDEVNRLDFSISQDYILRAFVMLHNSEVRFKIKNFTNDFVTTLEEEWDSIRKAIIELFKLMRSFGLSRFTLTSYNATLPILCYLYHARKFHDFNDAVKYEKERKEIKTWLLKALLLQSFGGSSDSTLQKSRGVFIESSKRNELRLRGNVTGFPSRDIERAINQPASFTDDEIDHILMDTQKGSKYSFTVLALLYPDLKYSDREFHEDHLHPFSSFNNEDTDTRYIANSVLNLQMLQGNENKSKNAMSLSDWVSKEEAKGRSRDRILNDALIPLNVSLDRRDFENFIEERKKLLRKTLRQNLGMQPPSTIIPHPPLNPFLTHS